MNKFSYLLIIYLFTFAQSGFSIEFNETKEQLNPMELVTVKEKATASIDVFNSALKTLDLSLAAVSSYSKVSVFHYTDKNPKDSYQAVIKGLIKSMKLEDLTTSFTVGESKSKSVSTRAHFPTKHLVDFPISIVESVSGDPEAASTQKVIETLNQSRSDLYHALKSALVADSSIRVFSGSLSDDDCHGGVYLAVINTESQQIVLAVLDAQLD